MEKNINKLLAENKTLSNEIIKLQQQLREARESIKAIKQGNIDALVVADKKLLKVFTEKTSDKTFRTLIEKMHEGAVTINEDETILYCNSYFANMVNLPLQKVIGTKFKNYIADSSKKQIESLFQQSRKSVIKEEIDIHASNGKIIPVLISANTLSLHDDFILSIILTDLTIKNKNQEELKRNAKHLEKKNLELEGMYKELETFTFISSHDLQEPLRKIKNFVAVLLEEEEKKLSDDGKKHLQRTYEVAKRMQALLEDLLTYSRTKNAERKFEKTDLNIILGEVKKDFEEVLEEKKATIKAGNLCKVNIIRFQFRQLMNNLIRNSLKFSKPRTASHITIKSEIVKGGKINNEKRSSPTSKLSPKIDYCHITYTDNGIGFDPQYNERIFEVFQRLHNKEEYEGTGMGLAICKRIVENHNGIITATGKLNGGARFDIFLPAA